jgi:hypothetical protein
MQPTDQYILWSVQRGGWLTKSALTHSDYREAQTFDRETALDRVKLWQGRLIIVNRADYIESIQGVNLDQR